MTLDRWHSWQRTFKTLALQESLIWWTDMGFKSQCHHSPLMWLYACVLTSLSFYFAPCGIMTVTPASWLLRLKWVSTGPAPRLAMAGDIFGVHTWWVWMEVQGWLSAGRSQKPGMSVEMLHRTTHPGHWWMQRVVQKGKCNQPSIATHFPFVNIQMLLCVSQKFPNWEKTLRTSHQLNIIMGRCQFTHSHLKPKSHWAA